MYSTPGAVAYFAPTFTTNLQTTVLQYGDNQTLLPGGVSLPLVIRVLDQNGLPIAGTGVSFGVPSGTTGTISPVNTVTGADGYAQAIYTAGSTPADIGSLSITATAGAAAGSFTVNVGTGQTAAPAALAIVSGTGQLITENPASTSPPTDTTPLVILATDSNGNPVPNALLTFTVTSGSGALQSPTGAAQSVLVAPTNTMGQASVTFLPPVVAVTEGFYSTTVTASFTNGTESTATTISQDFYLTSIALNDEYCSLPPCYPLVSPLFVQVLQPAPRTVFSGAADSTLPTPVKVGVYTSNFIPIPNVGVKVGTTSTSSTQTNSSCAGTNNGGLALTDATGVATCNVVLNGAPGTLPLTISVPESGAVSGSGLVFSGYTLTIIPGAPSKINIISGNNQISLTNTVLPVPFIVQVTDASGNPIPGTPVTWKVTSGAMGLSNVTTITSLTGEVTATGKVGSPGGSTVTVEVSAGTASATLTALVTVPVASAKIISGNNQSAAVNAAVSAPLVVEFLDSKANPAPNVPVTFAIVGTGKLSATSVVTGADGTATTNVTSLGYVAGPVTVSAATVVGGKLVQATFNLTALAPGPSGAVTILNSASLTATIAPGSLVTFFGSGLVPTLQGVVTDPTQMQGYSVSFDGISAPILALVNENGVEQINAQVPFEETVGTTDSVMIATPNGSIGVNSVAVSQFAPAIFTNGTLAPGEPLATAMRSDGSYVSSSNPVQPGEAITFFATGLGQTAPLAATGVPGVPDQIVGSTLYAGINNQSVSIVSAIYQPGAEGLYAVTVQIPSTAVAGSAVPLGLVMVDSQNNSFSALPVYVPIQ